MLQATIWFQTGSTSKSQGFYASAQLYDRTYEFLEAIKELLKIMPSQMVASLTLEYSGSKRNGRDAQANL